MSSFDEEEASKLFKVRRTTLQMLQDRGYSVDDSEIRMSRTEFTEKMGIGFKREDLLIRKTNPNNDADQIYVFFPNEMKFGIASLRNYINRMSADNVNKAILVLQLPLSHNVRKGIELLHSKLRVEAFQEEELVTNIKEHVLVPQHVVLTSEEKNALLKRYAIKDKQLPQIKITDPMARYYGLQRGQVVKIIRESETAGTYVTYRCAVNK